MKKGNLFLAMNMAGKKLRTSLGASVDLGLTGKEAVVHPSLEVRRWVFSDLYFFSFFVQMISESFLMIFFLFKGKC